MLTEDVKRMNRVIDSSGFSYEIARHKLQELRDEWGEERFFQALGEVTRTKIAKIKEKVA